MSYRVYIKHPYFGLSDGADQPRTWRGRCEGGPCGPNARHRYHHCRQHSQSDEQGQSPSTFVPAVDIYSTDTEYKVYISLPSAEKESIELTYDPNTKDLIVSGNLVRPAEFAGLDEEALQKVSLQSERKLGRFERKLKIPRDGGERIRFDDAAAKFENGVLELTLPKVEKEPPKAIVIG